MHILLALIFFPLLLSADIQIDDPKGILGSLSLPQKPFEEVWQCGQWHRFDSDVASATLKCRRGLCMLKKMSHRNRSDGRFELGVEDCSDEGAFIYGEGKIFEISKEEYMTYSHWILPFLRNLDDYIRPVKRIEIKEVRTQNYGYIHDGRMDPIQGLKIIFTAAPGMNTASMEFAVVVAKNMVGIKQILLFYQSPMFDTDEKEYFYKLRGIVDVR